MTEKDRKTILLVEDEPMNAVLAKAILKKYGYHVTSVSSGEKAVSAVDSESCIDLVLMDIDLGEGIDGTEAAELILEKHDIPVVFLSSHTEPEIVEKTEGITSYGYILKNAGETVLIASLKMAFRLYETEKKYRLIAENTSDGIFVFENGIITYVSPAYEKISGYTSTEMLGKTESEMINNVHPDDREVIASAIASAKEKRNSNLTYQCRAKNKGGEYIWREDNASFIYNEKGEMVKAYIVARDITERKNAEEHMLRLSEMVDSTPASITVHDGEGNFLYANRRTFEMHGFDKEEFMSANLNKIDLPESAELFNERVREIEEKGEATFEVRHYKKDGTFFPLEVTAKKFNWGGIPSILSIATDITEKKGARKAMKKALKRFNALLDNSPNFIALFDEHGRYVEVSESMAGLYGMSTEDVRSKSFAELLHPDVAEDFIKTIASLKEKKEPVLKIDIINLNGSDRIFESKLFPVMVEEDGTEIFGSISEDVTDRMRTEKSLLESQERFRALHNASFGGIAIHDKGLILEFNQGLAEMTGYSAEELIGMDGLHLIAEKSRDEVRENILSGYEKPYEVYGLKKNGEEYPLRLEARNVPYKGKTVRTVEFRDITDQKRIESEIRRENEINAALFRASQQVLKSEDFKHTARHVFDAICSLTGAVSGYVALLNDAGDENEVLFLESGGYNCTVDPSLPMPVRGLRGEAYRTGKPVYHNDFAGSEWVRFMPEGHAPLANVMFAPLVIEGKARGLIGVANKPSPFTEEDAKLSEVFAGLAAIALNNSRLLELTEQSEQKYWSLFESANDSIFLHGIMDDGRPGLFYEVNERACINLQYSREELLNLTVMDIAPEEAWEEAVMLTKKLMENRKLTFESKQKRKDGTVFPVEVSSSMFEQQGRMMTLSHARDITERKEADEKIKNLLKEKELILKEAHHRIKNNMNTVYGLLYLQADAQDDPVCSSILIDAASRVQSMTLLYDKLYRSDSHQEVNVSHYLGQLVKEIVSIFDSSVPVRYQVDVEDFVLGTQTLSTLGIIVTELITNTMKYAFSGRSEGSLELQLAREGNEVTLHYSDNGIGLPESETFENSKGFGMQLISMLVEQIGGTAEIIRGGGTAFIIRFST
ncbi:MAG TPA: PAS domain S-box protein [Spirochaetota bacterium]|mgnify:CR=1 FL=1|nr:PAS domain S-box protein [Spirochaetota bacterium]